MPVMLQTPGQYSPYTNNPSQSTSIVFPSHSHQVLSSFIQIIGASLLAYCIARRTDSDHIGPRSEWIHMPWAKICVILLFIDSWLFLVLSSILISGVGLSYSVPTCSLGIYVCVIFYAASKALIYLFLVERVWIVWNAGKSLSRRNSTIYRLLAAVIMGYSVIFVLLVVGHIAHIRDDGSCVIGLKNFASLPLLSYDLFVNILLTSMFIWPLQRSRHTTQRLRLLAWRTLAAAAVALTTSSVNIAILTVVGGKELAWVCLGSCATDVTINALVIFWVTAGAQKESVGDRRPQRSAVSGRKNGSRVPAGALSLSIPQSASQVLTAAGSPPPSRDNFVIKRDSEDDSGHVASLPYQQQQQPSRVRALKWPKNDRNRARNPAPPSNNAMAIYVNMDTYTITDDLPAPTNAGNGGEDSSDDVHQQKKLEQLEENDSDVHVDNVARISRSSTFSTPDRLDEKIDDLN